MKKITFLLSLLCILTCKTAFSQGGIYLRIDGFTTENTTGVHLQETKILAIEEGIVGPPPATGGGGTGKATAGDFLLKKSMSMVSNKIIKYLAAAQHIPYVEILFYDNTDVLFYKIRIQDVLFNKYTTLVPECNGCSNIFDQVGLSGTAIIWTNYMTTPNAVTTWNITANTITYVGP